MTRQIGRACLLTIALCLTFTSVARACDTPVYRYALYRWLPAPYEVYYFHEGALDDTAQQIKAAVEKAGETAEAPTNIVFLSVDLATDKDLVGVPPDIKAAWQKQDSPQIPSYFVSSPVGGHLFTGSLSLPDIEAMIDSPTRQQIGQALETGMAGVYILLTNDDAEASAQAEQVIQGVVDDVAAGKVSLYTLPSAIPGAAGSEEDVKDSKLEVGLVKVARSDVKEKWLVDILLSLERDLRETQEPIVFMIYGRGRALFSCLGKGIHRDNLVQDVKFITGACSCTVKEQNPGVDLLLRYNWDAAAEAIAARYGAEEGSRYDFGGDALFPELIIPAEGEMPGSGTTPTQEQAAQDETVAQMEPAADLVATGPQPEATATKALDQPVSSSEVTALRMQTKISPGPPDDLDPSPSSLVDDETSSDEAGQDPSTLHGVLWVGAGLLGALVVLFAATFVVLRPR